MFGDIDRMFIRKFSVRVKMMRLFKKFLGNKKGSVAITFGIAAVPIVLAMGVALDYVQASQLQARFLLAADNAGLAAASSDETEAGKLEKIVKEYLTQNGVMSGNFSEPKIKVAKLEDGNLQIELSTKMNTTMMRIIGRKTVSVKATSVISREFGDMDVALVLDNTGSMAGRKMRTLKRASAELINTLYDSKGRDSTVKVGLVPFADYVNIGMSNRNKSWADIDDDKTTRVRKTRWRRKVVSRYNCRWRTVYYYRDGQRRSYRYRQCQYRYGGWYRQTYWQTTRVRWYGCVGSRNYPWNTRDERPSLKIPGIMNRSCSRQLTELTDNKQTILREINAMSDSGSTYIPAGLMWGWRVVSSGQPFDNNAQANGSKSHQRAIVLMTDGENTVSPSYPAHNGRNKTTADRLTSEICENIKSSGEKVTIYTVAFEVRDVSTQTLLRNCATSPSHFFNADNSAQLAASFQKIAKSLALLRIAK